MEGNARACVLWWQEEFYRNVAKQLKGKALFQKIVGLLDGGKATVVASSFILDVTSMFYLRIQSTALTSGKFVELCQDLGFEEVFPNDPFAEQVHGKAKRTPGSFRFFSPTCAVPPPYTSWLRAQIDHKTGKEMTAAASDMQILPSVLVRGPSAPARNLGGTRRLLACFSSFCLQPEVVQDFVPMEQPHSAHSGISPSKPWVGPWGDVYPLDPDPLDPVPRSLSHNGELYPSSPFSVPADELVRRWGDEYGIPELPRPSELKYDDLCGREKPFSLLGGDVFDTDDPRPIWCAALSASSVVGGEDSNGDRSFEAYLGSLRLGMPAWRRSNLFSNVFPTDGRFDGESFLLANVDGAGLCYYKLKKSYRLRDLLVDAEVFRTLEEKFEPVAKAATNTTRTSCDKRFRLVTRSVFVKAPKAPKAGPRGRRWAKSAESVAAKNRKTWVHDCKIINLYYNILVTIFEIEGVMFNKRGRYICDANGKVAYSAPCKDEAASADIALEKLVEERAELFVASVEGRRYYPAGFLGGTIRPFTVIAIAQFAAAVASRNANEFAGRKVGKLKRRVFSKVRRGKFGFDIRYKEGWAALKERWNLPETVVLERGTNAQNEKYVLCVGLERLSQRSGSVTVTVHFEEIKPRVSLGFHFCSQVCEPGMAPSGPRMSSLPAGTTVILPGEELPTRWNERDDQRLKTGEREQILLVDENVARHVLETVTKLPIPSQKNTLLNPRLVTLSQPRTKMADKIEERKTLIDALTSARDQLKNSRSPEKAEKDLDKAQKHMDDLKSALQQLLVQCVDSTVLATFLESTMENGDEFLQDCKGLDDNVGLETDDGDDLEQLFAPRGELVRDTIEDLKRASRKIRKLELREQSEEDRKFTKLSQSLGAHVAHESTKLYQSLGPHVADLLEPVAAERPQKKPALSSEGVERRRRLATGMSKRQITKMQKQKETLACAVEREKRLARKEAERRRKKGLKLPSQPSSEDKSIQKFYARSIRRQIHLKSKKIRQKEAVITRSVRAFHQSEGSLRARKYEIVAWPKAESSWTQTKGKGKYRIVSRAVARIWKATSPCWAWEHFSRNSMLNYGCLLAVPHEAYTSNTCMWCFTFHKVRRVNRCRKCPNVNCPTREIGVHADLTGSLQMFTAMVCQSATLQSVNWP